ncbi:MAG: hypothetical protein SGPRY_014149, partial [Prymnesium sp.]
MGKVALTGTTGGLGQQAVKSLVQRGYSVRALARDPGSVPSSVSSLSEVELVRGDVTDPASLDELMEGCIACLALHGAHRTRKLSDLWSNPVDEPTHSAQVNYQGVANLIASAKASGACNRIVRITGKGETPWS